ncbi:anhydro-N-acetylmuramic acid kinase [Sulfurimonas aquatica]|uniref:Anhydro-N-acetylmuramic acid kinase n=1 Tax=Sulfurimonas aquatica TaxID=2672570 RepID=A0A975AY51_9BACT|nr:anhydro-N-acetylmuramic acid kinase [Sulfurimonas aquatica]QSZ40694.1 anhydro-N-acetylmuramic acid kinase [Sulfurimonas aquatica]
MSNLYIGVMSGTSLDGVDIALCDIDKSSCKLLAFEEYPFPKTLKEEVLSIINGVVTLKELGTLDAKLGELYSETLSQFLRSQKLNTKDINAIGLHGQTLWHEPHSKHPFSMQLGDANRVVAKTGIKTVADFRRMDIANGGEGAPFAPAFHKFLFEKLEGNIAVLNIGGMANITLLGSTLRGWDTGCGNVLLDMWMSKTQEKSYDKNGEFAQGGKVISELLEDMLNDEYFKKEPPKSTGREYFNESWFAKFLPIFNAYKDRDIMRTLLELTAKTVANDLNKTDATKLILCGGGTRNGFLVKRLSELCSCEINRSEEFGVSSDALEAMAFAWLAYKRINNEVVELSSVTGSKKDSQLGAIYG